MKEKKSILLIDSDANTRALVKETLSSFNIPNMVVEAEDGVQGNHKANRQRFDLVVMDMKLPMKNGNSVLESFAALDSKTRPESIFLLTDLPFENSWRNLFPFEVLHYLKKPCSLEVLKPRLESLLTKSKESSANQLSVDLINAMMEVLPPLLAQIASIEIKKESVFIRKPHQPTGDISTRFDCDGAFWTASIAVAFDDIGIKSLLDSNWSKKITASKDLKEGSTEISEWLIKIMRERLLTLGYPFSLKGKWTLMQPAHPLAHSLHTPIFSARYQLPQGNLTLEVCTQIKEL